jgi:hypothetical protein
MKFIDPGLVISIANLNLLKYGIPDTLSDRIQITKNIIQAHQQSSKKLLTGIASYMREKIDTNINEWLQQEIKDENLDTLTESFEDILEPGSSADEIFDLQSRRQLNKKAMDALFGNTNLYQIRLLINPSSVYKRTYVLFDTDNASATLSEGARFRWQYLPQPLIRDGTVNTISEINNLVGMRLYPIKATLDSNPTIFPPGGITDPFVMPTFDNDVVMPNNVLTVFIEEFKAQSYIAKEGRRFHFVIFPVLADEVIILGRAVLPPIPAYYEFVTSGKGNGWFYFRRPVKTFDTFTISIADPIDLIQNNNNVRTLIPIEFIYLDDEFKN